MSKNQPSATSTDKQTTLPEPITPIDGALAHVRAVPFEWTAVEGDAEYRIQIARDFEFSDVVATVSTGDATSVTLYHTLDEYADADLFWRVGTGPSGPWGPVATFHAAGEERVRTEQSARDRAARQAANESLAQHLAKQERVPVTLPEEGEAGRRAAIILGMIVASFVILLVLLFIFGWIEYPAEAVLQ